jgi:DNA helicase-2/ATP-dependent DNA helicase PcrA
LYEIGDRVKHRRFGTGQVLEISGENLTIDFGHAGQKRIRANYVQKAA